jgi:hypothetical protein
MEKEFLNYTITDSGQVISPTTKKTMYVHNNKVTLGGRNTRHQFSLPRLVFSLFRRELESHEQIKHIDGNRNNNHVENLMILSSQERGEALTKNRLKKTNK